MGALLFLTIAGTCWWVWDRQLARHPTQLFGQLRQQGLTKKEVQHHLVSWLPDCPGNKHSGGKRRSSATRTGNTSGRSGLDHLPYEGQAFSPVRTLARSFTQGLRRGVALQSLLTPISDSPIAASEVCALTPKVVVSSFF